MWKTNSSGYGHWKCPGWFIIYLLNLCTVPSQAHMDSGWFPTDTQVLIFILTLAPKNKC